MRNVKAKMATHQVEQDLLDLIASWVLAGDLLDYVRFRAVCLRWRAETPSPRGRGVVDPCFHPRQWMMFPEGGGLFPGNPALLGYVRFFNISTGTFVRVRLPCFRNHSVLDCPDGLLLLQHNESSAIRLLHPFLFPPLSSIFPQLSQAGVLRERI
ncbi:hypothetical protein ACQ4PT_015740 [Festuca glaucescens]